MSAQYGKCLYPLLYNKKEKERKKEKGHKEKKGSITKEKKEEKKERKIRQKNEVHFLPHGFLNYINKSLYFHM